MSKYLNGYARIVEYQVYDKNQYNNWDPYANKFKGNRFHMMIEGVFKDGKPNGYARYMKQNKIQVGYFKEGKPFGKMMFIENGLVVDQGIIDETHNAFERDYFHNMNSSQLSSMRYK